MQTKRKRKEGKWKRWALHWKRWIHVPKRARPFVGTGTGATIFPAFLQFLLTGGCPSKLKKNETEKKKAPWRQSATAWGCGFQTSLKAVKTCVNKLKCWRKKKRKKLGNEDVNKWRKLLEEYVTRKRKKENSLESSSVRSGVYASKRKIQCTHSYICFTCAWASTFFLSFVHNKYWREEVLQQMERGECG